MLIRPVFAVELVFRRQMHIVPSDEPRSPHSLAFSRSVVFLAL